MDSLDDWDTCSSRHTFSVEEINRPLLYPKGICEVNLHRNMQLSIGGDWIGFDYWHSSAFPEAFFYSISDYVSIGINQMPYIKCQIIGKNKISGRRVDAPKFQLVIGGGIYWIHIRDYYYWDKNFYIEHTYNTDMKLILNKHFWSTLSCVGNFYNNKLADILIDMALYRQTGRYLAVNINSGWWLTRYFYTNNYENRFHLGLGSKVNIGRVAAIYLNASPYSTTSFDYFGVDFRGGILFTW